MTRTLTVMCILFGALICGMAPKAAAPHFGPTGYYEIATASFRTGTFLKAVDTNGDSCTDLVVVTAGSTKISVLFGDGHGKFKNRLDSDIDGIVYSGGNVDRKSTRLNSSHLGISYAVFCLKKKT